MIREVDLVSYLPPFLAEYKETNLTLTAENPEFVLLWKAFDRTLKNEFIATADESGISRFEKILHIVPSEGESLENRRTRVHSQWFTRLPYTWRMLLQKMSIICKGKNFKIYVSQDICYKLEIQVFIEPQEETLLQEVEQMLENYLPMNLCYQVMGNIVRIKEAGIFTGATKCVYVKIKAGLGTTPVQLFRSTTIGIETGTMKQIRVAYLPERGQR